MNDLAPLQLVLEHCLRDLARALVDTPLDHLRLRALAAAAMAANGIASRTLREPHDGPPVTDLRTAVEASVALSRPQMPETALSLGGVSAAQVSAREVDVVWALHGALLVARRRAARAHVQAFRAGDRAHIHVGWMGTLRDDVAGATLGATAQMVAALGGTLAVIDDGLRIELPVETTR